MDTTPTTAELATSCSLLDTSATVVSTAAELVTSSVLVDSSATAAITAAEFTSSSALADAPALEVKDELAHSFVLADASAAEVKAEFATPSALSDASAAVITSALEAITDAELATSSALADASAIVVSAGAELASSSALVDSSAIAATTPAEPTTSAFVDASPLASVAVVELPHRTTFESEVEESGVSEEPIQIANEEYNGQVRREDEEQAMSKSGKRRLQHVSTKKAQKKVLLWMIKEVERSNTDKNIVSKAVKEFPLEFRSQSKANLQKASRWWKHREEFLELVGKTSEALSLSTNHNGPNSKQVRTKALNGRGRKREAWVEWLHNELIDEFVRLKKASVKLSSRLLLTFASDILEKSEHPDFNRDAVAKDGVKLTSKLTPRWIQCFQERFDISLRR